MVICTHFDQVGVFPIVVAFSLLTWLYHLYRRVLLEMRRSRDEFEAAREKFQTARAEFNNMLNVWSGKELLRDRDYNQKLARHWETLQKLGSQHSSFEPCISDAETMSGALVCSKLQAEEFVYISQQILTKKLLELQDLFVSTIRKLADQANRDRVESLGETMSAFRNDVESELLNEILVDLEFLAVNVRTLAFQKIRNSLKKERVRYSASEVYRKFEDAVAKPILSLQENIGDDIGPETTIEDLGLLVRAPVAAIAAIPYVLSVGVWLLMTKTKKYHFNMSVLATQYRNKIVIPFLRDLGEEGSKSLKSALIQSSAAAESTVEYALHREEARYERRRKKCRKWQSSWRRT